MTGIIPILSALKVGDHEVRHVRGGRGQSRRWDIQEQPIGHHGLFSGGIVVGRSHIGAERWRLLKRAPLHLERLQDVLGHVLRERNSRDVLDDQPEQVVGGIRVQELLSGGLHRREGSLRQITIQWQPFRASAR